MNPAGWLVNPRTGIKWCRHCLLSCRQQQLRPAATASAFAQQPPKVLANAAGQSADDLAKAAPRWARTPPSMKAPHGTRPKNDNDEYPCNEDPARLDAAYVKVLGNDGDKLLSEDIKWLAVTHKSFDHGRRGFNDRLAFLGEHEYDPWRDQVNHVGQGRRVIELQTSLALLDAPQSERQKRARSFPDQYGRMPFEHHSLHNLENIQTPIKESILDKKRLAQLAERYGLGDVIRWKPRQVCILAAEFGSPQRLKQHLIELAAQIRDLQASGIDIVLNNTIFAIVGALALQKGGEVANQAVRQRILQPLGIT